MAYLDLRLEANRPMAAVSTRWVVGGIAAVVALGGLRLVAIGAWPVLPFLVLDVVLLGWALAATARRAAAYERVELDDATLLVRRVSPGGAVRTIALDPRGATVELASVARGTALWLAADGRRVRLGDFLTAEERRDVAAVIARAIEAWRRR